MATTRGNINQNLNSRSGNINSSTVIPKSTPSPIGYVHRAGAYDGDDDDEQEEKSEQEKAKQRAYQLLHALKLAHVAYTQVLCEPFV
jgi:hypothetical protein